MDHVSAIRIGVTLLSLIAFIGVSVWALQRRNQAGFAEAAQLPFRESTPSDDLRTQGHPT